MPGNHFFDNESSDEDMAADDIEEPEHPVEELIEYERKCEAEERRDQQKPVISPLTTSEVSPPVREIFRFGSSDDSASADSDEDAEPLDASDGSKTKAPDRRACPHAELRRGLRPDVERDVQEIRELLSIHAEILDRCARDATPASDGGTAIALSRRGFEEVRTRQTGSRLALLARPTRSERTFDLSSLSRLPEGLEGTLAVLRRDAPFGGTIDYGDLFRKAMTLLCDDVLRLFLPRLVEHLEAGLAPLEDMDEWSAQPGDNARFLERVFMKELDPADASERVLAECAVSGTYATAFDLSVGSERARLVRFLFYVCG